MLTFVRSVALRDLFLTVPWASVSPEDVTVLFWLFVPQVEGCFKRMAIHFNYNEGCLHRDLSFLRQNLKIISTWALCAGEHRQEKGEGLMLPKNNSCFQQNLFM